MKRISIFTYLSVGFIILGIGCMSFALYNIWTQSFNLHFVSPNQHLSPKPIVQKKIKLEKGIGNKTQTYTSIAKEIYTVYPTKGDKIGNLTIPALKRELPIIQGTGTKELRQGVGHFTQSVLPGEIDNCVFSGHRDTVFKNLGTLKIGDQLIVQTSAGIFTYEVNGTRIVHKDDKTVIVPTKNAILTVTTCYPFNFIGDAPDRYIVTARLVKTKSNI